MRETSVPFDNAVSCYYYIASVAYEDVYEAMAEWYRKGETKILGEKNQSQWHFFHHKSHMHWPEIEPVYITLQLYI